LIDYSRVLNDTVVGIKPSGIRKFFDIARTLDGCISLGVGEPDFVTPWAIREAGIVSLERGRTWYTGNSGLEPLRKSVCGYLKRRFDMNYEPDSVVITVGGSEAIDLCVRAVINSGDEVIIPMPCYVAYDPIVRLCGGVTVPVVTKAENGFRITGDELRAAITDRTKLLVLPFPNNPTGAVMRREHLEELAEVLRDTNILVLSDEIYAELTYGGERHVSPASISDDMYARTVIVNGFSKAFAMTGWRLGYCCGPDEIVRQMLKIHQFAIMCAPTTSQYAAIAAMESCDGEVEKMVEEYAMRRRLMVDGFNRMGLTCADPNGAFYVFPSIESTGLTADEFCEKLLYAQRVAVVPGTAFGDCGEGHIRASYAQSVGQLSEALRRIEKFVKELKS